MPLRDFGYQMLNKKAPQHIVGLRSSGWARTSDPLINSQML